MGLVGGITQAIWWRWMSFGWVGRIASIGIGLYIAAWALDNLGMDGAAYQFKEKALFILGALLIALFFRMIWRDQTKRW
jgi:hypothetical protein